jgi:serine/threonine protein kinase
MDAKRWAQIDHLLDEALERAPDERAAFVAAACGEDAELRSEIESLLAAHAKAEAKFMQVPALDVAAQQLAKAKQRTLIGQEFGRYKVLSSLGVGGMGEVYLAADAKLSRKVALKFLPTQFTQDAARVKRFIREAKTVSALNHPNIITIYEIGISDDEHFLATEFVDGQTLRERLAHGRLPLKEALEIALQISAALDAAHDAGIVHRDIKPENVMLRRDGYVKVLDFGLAKLIERPGERGTGRLGDAGNPSALRNPLSGVFTTQPGIVLGTVNYMSPEQSLGQEVDRRSDLFSLGIVLYELVTGAPPFKGDSTISVLDAIAHQPQAPITQFNGDLPLELERILNRALEKDREMRYQTASDMRSVLKRLQRELDSADLHMVRPLPLPKPASGLAKPWWGLAAAAGCLLLAWGIWYWFGAGARPQATDWSRLKYTRITELSDRENNPSISPDGQAVTYMRQLNGQWDIFWQRLGSNNPRNLTEHPSFDGDPAFSPNGELIAFYSTRAGEGLYVMGVNGENVRRLTEGGREPDWSPNGQEIVYSTHYGGNVLSRINVGGQLWIVNLATNEKRPLPAGEDAVQPRWSPHGSRIAYWGLRDGVRREIWTIPATGGQPVPVIQDEYDNGGPVWSPDGQSLYFLSNRNGRLGFWRMAIDEASGMPQGAPEFVPTSDYSLDLSLAIQASTGDQRMVYTNRRQTSPIFRVAFDAARGQATGQPMPVTQNDKYSPTPSISPDGEWLAYYSFGDPQFDIYVVRQDGTGMRQLTNDLAKDRYPRWSPDGQRLAFFTNRTGKYEIWTMRPDGGDLQQVSFSTPEQPGFVAPIWAPDGQRMAISIRGEGGYLLDLTRPWQAQQLVKLPAPSPNHWFLPFDWSPDNQKLAGYTGDLKIEEPGLVIYNLQTQQFKRLNHEGDLAHWLRDNRHLLYSAKGKVWLIDSLNGATREVFALAGRDLSDAVLSPDEKWLYFCDYSTEEDIWLATLPKQR